MQRLRRRDRRGRGLRGPLAPPHVPFVRTRAERFDEFVLDAVERLERRWAAQLRDVEFAVEDVPAGDPLTGAEPIALARLERGRAGTPPRIVVYRWPIEARIHDRADLPEIVHELVVEQVAELLGLDPDAVDPRYRDPDD